ncbi:MAG: T9SS type A sorting domain-containing protein [Bacteroidota bacterium]
MKKLLLLIFTCIIFVAKAQNGFTTYTTNLTIPGLLKFQRALLVDNSGNKWIGFQTISSGANGGLVKYDNTNWTFYNKNSIPAFQSNYVTSLAKDNSGNIWIGCDSGLVKFDGITFTSYGTAQGLPMKFVNCVEVVGNQVYVGTKKGLSRFDGTSFTNYNVANGKLSYDTITCIKAENANVIWLGTRNHLTEFSIDNTFSVTSYTSNSTIANAGVLNCIYIDSQNAKWLGTSNLGILKFTGSVFGNANDLYSIIGSVIPNAVIDISEGLHNGIVFKHAPGTVAPNLISGLTELTPDGKVYQYYYPVATQTLGNYIEKDGSDIIVTFSTGYVAPNMYYKFNEANYTAPFGTITDRNFSFLDINNVRAGIANRNDMHWDIGGSKKALYEVPKGSGKHSNFSSALWIGGLDAAGQLHGGAKTYRQGTDFWPGILDTTNATIDTVTAIAYDKIWKVSYMDINTFVNAFNSGSVVATPDMLSWPAHGTGDNARNLAPFVDTNGDGIYNPNDGDYPKIKGDQALYYIYNDKLAAHSSSFAPMGIEVQCMAYAYGCPAVVNGHNELIYTTFYDYRIINRSSENYHDVYVSLWSEVDLGYYGDDYIGSNVEDNYGFAYNADNNDQSSAGYNGYGNYIPAQGFKIIKSPLATTDGIDNDFDGTTDESDEMLGMSKFGYFGNTVPSVPTPYTWPVYGTDYYTYMKGQWKDSTSITCGGNGYGGTVNTNWIYTGDPSTTGLNTDPNNSCGFYWKESMVASDRNFVLGTGPFNLNAGQMQEVEYAFVTSFDSSSTSNSNILSVAKLKTDMQKVTAFYNQANKPNCLQEITIGINESVKQNEFFIYPNPAKSGITIASTINGILKINYEIVDVLGKVLIQNMHTGSEKFSINITDLNSGIYFLRLQVNNSFVIKKFVKE